MSDVERKWGHLRYFRKVTANEWKAECPKCGTAGHDWSNPKDLPDRFHMHPQDHLGPARGKCRQCGHFEWAVDTERGPLTESKVRRREAARRKAERQERNEYKKRLERFRKEKEWVKAHQQLDEWGRNLWRRAGIPDSLQDRLVLGQGEKVYHGVGDDLHTARALTIPYFNHGWEAVQLQYRLVNPVKGAGKYRWTSGLGSRFYLTDPDNGVEGDVLLAEGAKKAIVAYLELVLRGDQRHLTIIATPSKTPSQRNIKRLEKADVVYVCLDPDAFDVDVGGESAVERLTGMIGYERVRIVSLPDKIDDLINLGATWRDIMPLIERARKP